MSQDLIHIDLDVDMGTVKSSQVFSNKLYVEKFFPILQKEFVSLASFIFLNYFLGAIF